MLSMILSLVSLLATAAETPLLTYIPNAYEFVSQNAKASIVEMVDPEYTVMVKIERKRLPVRISPSK